jgi:hypothetical protein
MVTHVTLLCMPHAQHLSIITKKITARYELSGLEGDFLKYLLE